MKFKTFGCGAAVATSSMVTEMVMGKTLDEAAEISNRAVAEALGGLPAQKMHCSNLAADALHLAIEDYLTKAGRSGDVAKVLGKKASVVGLSGGVDSAVAALALREAGYARARRHREALAGRRRAELLLAGRRGAGARQRARHRRRRTSA